MIDFDRLRAPPEDGDLLLEPPPSLWPAMLDGARRAPLPQVALAGVPVGQVRDGTRRRLWDAGPDGAVVACGHQPAFIHPGVWAKNVVVSHLIRELGLVGGDLVVDNDAPPGGELAVPCVGPDGLVGLCRVAWSEGAAGSAYEGRPALSAAAIEEAARRIAAAMGEPFEESAMPAYLAGCGRGGRDVVEQHQAGRARVDAALGAALRACRVSEVVGGPFVADLLLEAARFAAAYNGALQAYRSACGVRGSQRPLPDLARRGGAVETALWIYRPGEPRRRLWVERSGDSLYLYADEAAVGRLGADDLRRDAEAALAALAPRVIRPRALALTLWARLLACDLFVHGIGGAKYDRITDGIFRMYYRCEPPPFVAVSATLRLGLPRHQKAQADLAAARHRLRDLRFNPQRYVADAPAPLLARRSELIAESGQLRASRGPSAARRQVFLDLRQVCAELTASDPGVGRRLAARIEELSAQAASDRLAAGREYFYALQPRRRLAALADRLAEAIRPVLAPGGMRGHPGSR